MDSELAVLQAALDRILARDPKLAEEIRDSHPKVAAELPGVGVPEVAGGRLDAATLKGALETIVRTKGRPVLTVRKDDFTFAATDLESDVWRDRLRAAHGRLRAAIPSVGRVELANNSDYTWVGTAWLVEDDIAVTNRHVAEVFAVRRSERFVFRADPGFADPMACSIDFRQEDGEPSTRDFKVTGVVYIEPEAGPDLAFLKVVQESGGDRLAAPIKLSTRAPARDQFLAAIGYPARDSRVPDQALVSRIFGDIYDKKRLAPGALTNVTTQLLTHDASTLGGNSGCVLLDLDSGEAVGLHRAGLYLQGNFAVPAAVVADRLKQMKNGRPRVASTSGLAPRPRPAPPGRHRPAPKPQEHPNPVPADGAVTWTIPLQVTVHLGQPVISVASAAIHTPSVSVAPSGGDGSVEGAVEAVRRQLGGHEGIVSVRTGYRFADGWITDERAVVVAFNGERPDLPETVAGVPVEVTPASPWDLLEATATTESLEGVPRTHYKPPPDIELTEVDEEMRVVCHVSPDAGWPTLQAFLSEKTSRLTIGIYDFTAPHVIDAVRAAVKVAPHKLNLVIQHGAAMGEGVKADDIPDEKVVEDFKKLLKGRFKQAWASVSGPERLFASAYHIKVIVRDGEAFWLSSGNMQSSNQPNIDPVADGEKTFGPLRTFNREWHAVVENAALAAQFERFLLWDLEQANQVAEETLVAEVPTVLVPVEAFAERPEPEAVAKARYFPPFDETRRFRVRPLLTPDNFQPEVLKLIRGAKKRILFQNQSLNLLDGNEPGFQELVTALRDKQEELEDVRIIIRGDFNPRPVLEKLKAFGFDMSKVRAQKKCHTKGIVIDSAVAVLGSHNWTNQGALVNRDASLVFFDEGVAKYYEPIFEFDWKNLAKQQLDEELPAVELTSRDAEAPEGMVKMSLFDLLYGDG